MADPTPDPNAPIPDRGYGYRYGTKQNPDTEGWGSLPPYDSPVKGNGYYGMLGRSDSPDQRSSEYSIGVTIGGKNYHVPSLVPGLTQGEINAVLAGQIPHSVAMKATQWAQQRITNHLPVYATAPEEGAYTPLQEALPMDRSFAPSQLPMDGH